MNTAPRIRVLQYITELSIGGAQMTMLDLLSGIDRDRFDITVACLYNGDGVIAQRIRALGIPVVDLGMQKKWRFDALWRLSWLCRRRQPDILHTWMFHPNISGRIIGRLAGVDLVISSEHTMGQESDLRLRLNRETSGLVDKVICVSERVADFAKTRIGLPADKQVVIANGVDLTKFDHPADSASIRQRLRLPLDSFIVCAIGRPRPVKGYGYLIDAFALLVEQDDSLHLLFVGDGPDRNALKAQVSRLGLTARVTFLGDQKDIPDLLPGVDLLVSSSLWEGMPIVVLEAMAARVAVVATDVGGTSEIVVHEQTGLLAEPQNPRSLADAILRMRNDADLRDRLATQGQAAVREHYSMAENIRRTEQLYIELVTGKQTGKSGV